MIKTDKVWLQLTRTEANALMVMLDGEMESILEQSWHGNITTLADWETFDLDAYKLLAYKHYREWYEDNCGDD
tara:strand:+ start:597 stop:815 length:219 start_codon:yes stop_codon:yes gene_type:complete